MFSGVMGRPSFQILDTLAEKLARMLLWTFLWNASLEASGACSVPAFQARNRIETQKIGLTIGQIVFRPARQSEMYTFQVHPAQRPQSTRQAPQSEACPAHPG
jgi:hypothetical protein